MSHEIVPPKGACPVFRWRGGGNTILLPTIEFLEATVADLSGLRQVREAVHLVLQDVPASSSLFSASVTRVCRYLSIELQRGSVQLAIAVTCTVRHRHVTSRRQPGVCRRSRGCVPHSRIGIHRRSRRRRCLSRRSRQRASKLALWVPFDTVPQDPHACACGFATSAVAPVAVGTGHQRP